MKFVFCCSAIRSIYNTIIFFKQKKVQTNSFWSITKRWKQWKISEKIYICIKNYFHLVIFLSEEQNECWSLISGKIKCPIWTWQTEPYIQDETALLCLTKLHKPFMCIHIQYRDPSCITGITFQKTPPVGENLWSSSVRFIVLFI